MRKHAVAATLACLFLTAALSNAAPSSQDTSATTTRARVINGHCVDQDGHPIVGLKVRLYRGSSKDETCKMLGESSSDADGRFSLQQPPKESESSDLILAKPAAGSIAYARAPEGEDVPDVALVTRKTVDLKGTVSGPGGKALGNVKVWVLSMIFQEGQNHRVWWFFEPMACAAVSGPSGEFTITGLPEDVSQVRIVARCAGFADVFEQFPLANAVKLKMVQEGRITGRVTFGEGGKAAPKVNVYAQDIGIIGQWKHAITDERGEYTLEGLGPNSFNIWAECPDLTVIAVDSIKVISGHSIDAPDMPLIPGGFIDGKVVDESSGLPVKPKELFEVSWQGPARPRSGPAIESTSIKDDGTFHMRAAPGLNALYLQITSPWKQAGEQYVWADVKAGETAEVTIKIRHMNERELRQEADMKRLNGIRVP